MPHHRSTSPPRSLPLSLPLAFAAPLALATPLALAALSGLSGCAAPSPAAVAPQEREAPRAGAPVTRGTIMAPGADEEVAQQVAELRAAEAQLETALATGLDRDSDGIPDSADAPSPSATSKGGATPPQKKGAPAKAGARRPSAESAPRDKANAIEPKAEVGAATEPVDPCGSACAALASMSRATAHLCSLAGDSDARCEDARTRVRSAEGRVRAACPACAAR